VIVRPRGRSSLNSGGHGQILASRRLLLARLRDDVGRLREKLTQLAQECELLETAEAAGTLSNAETPRLQVLRREQNWLHAELAVLRAEFATLQEDGQK
jgi:hypothetical protein